MNHPNKTIILPKTKNQEITKRKENNPIDQPSHAVKNLPNTHIEDLDPTFTSDRVPGPFVQAVKYFFPEAGTIEEYWKMTTIAAYRHNYENETDKILEIAIHSFKQMINKLKAKAVRNPISYYFGVLSRKLEELYFEELLDMGFCEGELE